jgi:hypothetical protein
MTYIRNWLPKKEPWLPCDYDDETVYAVRAVSSGTANEFQQKLFFDYLMYVSKACDEFADLSYRPGPDGDRDTIFAEGKRFVGQQVRKLLRPEYNPGPKHQETSDDKTLSRRQMAQRLRRNRENREKGIR